MIDVASNMVKKYLKDSSYRFKNWLYGTLLWNTAIINHTFIVFFYNFGDQNMKFSIKDVFSEGDQIFSLLVTLKKSIIGNLISCALINIWFLQMHIN